MTDEVTELKEELARLKAEYEAFAYIVSHDLSAPFRHVSGFAQIIAQNHADDFDDKSKKHLDFIIRGSEKGSKLMDALLRYSRLNTKAQAFKLVDLDSVVSQVLTKLSAVIDVQGAEIICPKLPTVIGEEKQLTQLFYDLIHNALLYQPADNTPRITITAENQPDQWQFSIQDNGIGIQQGTEEKIFKPLRRGVKDEDYPGDGMGLAFAKNIVSRHRGKLWVDTTNSEGTAFHFTIQKKLTNQ